MDEEKMKVYKLFDGDQTIQRYVEQTEANNEESIKGTVEKIIDYASNNLSDHIPNDDYLTEDFVRKYVQGSVKNQ